MSTPTKELHNDDFIVYSLLFYCYSYTRTNKHCHRIRCTKQRSQSGFALHVWSDDCVWLITCSFRYLQHTLYACFTKNPVFYATFGSLYMLYLAYQVYKMDLSKKQTSTKQASFLSGFLMQFLNPKVVLFTMTVIPSFILPYYVDLPTVSLSVVGITFIGFLAFLLWVGFGAMFKKLFRTYQKTTNLIMALFLVYAAIMIWV